LPTSTVLPNLSQSMETDVAATGVCRSKSEETGAEYATVDYATIGQLGSVARAIYEKRGYLPAYDELPVCEPAKADDV
jgi:hypothetical protein